MSLFSVPALKFLPPEAGCSFSSNNFTKRKSKTNAPSHLPAIHQPPAALLICRPGKDPQHTSRGYTRGCVDLASGLPGTELGGKEEHSKIFCAEARQQRVPSPPSVQSPLNISGLHCLGSAFGVLAGNANIRRQYFRKPQSYLIFLEDRFRE